jgi:hypothetical protein
MLKPIRSIIRPFYRAAVMSFLWNNRYELARWAGKARETVASTAQTVSTKIAEYRQHRETVVDPPSVDADLDAPIAVI